MEPVGTFAPARFSMVEHQLRRQGIHDEKVLAAMARIPRHLFLPPPRRTEAYAPKAVPIEEGQTLSQPFMVALMSQELEIRGGEKVLEVGTGSGYQAAVLAEMGARVYSIERHERLAQGARAVLDALGYPEVVLSVGDGSRGWLAEAPFDRILVTAAAPALSRELRAQLGRPGILVAPVGGRHLQTLQILRREAEGDTVREGCACRFVPLVGAEGFEEEPGDPARRKERG